MPDAQTSSSADQEATPVTRGGLLYAFSAYGIWWFFPLYFAALMPGNPFETVGYRVIFSLVFCLILITATRNWRELWEAVSSPRTLFTLLLASFFVLINWELYIYALSANEVLETSLGYFINPLVSVLLGVLFFKERMRPMQWVSVSIAALAVITMGVALGQLPWIALVLAFSFGLYGFVKKRLGTRVSAIIGLTVESAWVLPIAIVQLVILGQLGVLSGLSMGPWHTVLLILSGPLTALPLIFFASAAKRLPLYALGFIQYTIPISSFLLGVFYFHETMPAARWVGFGLIWVALIVLSVDIVRQLKASRHNRLAQALQLSDPLPE